MFHWTYIVRYLYSTCIITCLRMNSQLSSNLKSEFHFKGPWTNHSGSYIITFGVIPINYCLPICIPAVSFHWNCLSFVSKMSFSLQSIKQKVSVLILLDLSAALDTIDHKILLSRLSSFYGLSSTALNLIASYRFCRTQSVSIQSHSTPSTIFTGIPQGFVLGPLLFSLYTNPISQIFNTKASISYQLYAGDTQIYISFSPNQSYDSLFLLSSTLDEVYVWLTSNRLSVNPPKTEYLVIGNS